MHGKLRVGVLFDSERIQLRDYAQIVLVVKNASAGGALRLS
jgi:hypothetical protein